MRAAASPVLLVVRLAALLVLPACEAWDVFDTQFEETEGAVLYRDRTPEAAPAPSGRLRVMNWNVKFGGGRLDFFFDCHGNEALMSRAQVVAHLDGLAAKIREVDPDVLFVQEVDRPSKRSAYVDQVQYLLDHTDLNHAAYASQWRADFVPSDGVGRIDSGQAVLSRWPLTGARRLALPLVGEYDDLKRYFYLQRGLLEATVEVPGLDGGLAVLVVHTEAYSHDGTKERQIRRFEEHLDGLDAAGRLFVAGGDLNTLPPGSDKVRDFPDAVCTDQAFRDDDYSEEADVLASLYAKYEPETPLADYQADNARYFTHTVDGRAYWNRKLDYLFTNGDFAAGSGVTYQDASSGPGCEAGTCLPTMPLSDHAPISAELVLP